MHMRKLLRCDEITLVYYAEEDLMHIKVYMCSVLLFQPISEY